MRAIILAAGKGLRLQLTDAEPAKCLLRVGGTTLIERQLGYLRSCGVTQVAVVVGFQAGHIRRTCGTEIEYIENPVFAETNSMYSLWLARRFFADGFVVMNSDVLFHPQLLRDLLTAPHDDAILVSYRNGTQYGSEEMKVKVRDGHLLEISKSMEPDEADGENVGIVKFGRIGAAVLARELDDLVAKGELRTWAPRAFLEFTKKRPLPVVGTRGYPWIEIDFPEDLRRAREEILPQIPEFFPLDASASAHEGR
jgi:L-glutamine-phosphate cytidylyltransferase